MKLFSYFLFLFLLAVNLVAQDKFTYGAVDAIIQDKCIVCHNHTTRKGDLNLESYAALMNGGKRGAPVVVGNPQKACSSNFSKAR